MQTGKFELSELKKALDYIEANSNTKYVEITMDGKVIDFSCFDRQDHQVLITVYDTNSHFKPKKKVVSEL